MQGIETVFWPISQPRLIMLEKPEHITQYRNNQFIEFEACFNEHYEGLHRYAFSLLRDNEEAKDTVQTIFIKLWEKRNEIIIQHTVKSYLYKSVYNLCLNKKRNDKAKAKYVSLVTKEHSTTDFIDEAGTKETYRRVLQAIESLPEQCRAVFQKSRWEEKKYSEIAAELNISVKTVEAHMTKALKLLREKILFVLLLINLFIK